MTEYSKEIYPLKNKSKEGVQHYGFFILVDGNKHIRQWHWPKVAGHVFMTKDEASTLADTMIEELSSNNVSSSETPYDSLDTLSIKDKVNMLQKELDVIKSQLNV